MVARLTDGCDMRCQRQLAVDDDAKVASIFGDSDARAEHQDFLARDLVEQRTQAEPNQLCLCRVQLQSIQSMQLKTHFLVAPLMFSDVFNVCYLTL